VVAAASIVVALQQIVSRSVHYLDSAVVSVSTIHGGEARNVLPDEVRMTGTIRTLRQSVYEHVRKRVQEVVESVAVANACTAEVTFVDLYPELVNAPGPAKIATEAAKAILGPSDGKDSSGSPVSSEELPVLGGEDFAFYTKARPGCYWFVGTEEEGRPNPMLHATTFDFNDRALPIAIAMFLKVVDMRLGASICKMAKVPETVKADDFLPPSSATSCCSSKDASPVAAGGGGSDEKGNQHD